MSDVACLLPEIAWQGFAVMGRLPGPPRVAAGTPSATATGWQLEIEGRGPRNWEQLAQELIAPDSEGAGAPAYLLTGGDAAECVFRAAAFSGDCLTGALLVAPRPLQIDRAWLVARLGTDLGPGERFRLLDGRPSGAITPQRRTVCYCHQVGDNEIEEAIARGFDTLDAIGETTRAGTNCGSCRPRIAQFLEQRDIG